MSKYIIDVGDGYIRHGLERTLTIPVRINDYEDHWMDTRIPVTPYAEPDTNEAYQRGREEGYAVGEAKKNSVEDEAYQRGLNDAWEAAKKLQEIDMYTIREIFGWVAGKWEVFIRYTASEAIEKIRQYEQEQKQEEEQIRVGDEVILDGEKCVVLVVDEDGIPEKLLEPDGYTLTLTTDVKLPKTGRHFSEIAAVLAKMKEES